MVDDKENIKLKSTVATKIFTVDDHNKMIKTIDEVITDLKAFNVSNNLELDNAIKSLLESSGRINNYYKSINNPIQHIKDDPEKN